MDFQAVYSSNTDYDQRNFIKFEVLLNKIARNFHPELSSALGKPTKRTMKQSVKSIQEGRMNVKEQCDGERNIHLENVLSELASETIIPKTILFRIVNYVSSSVR